MDEERTITPNEIASLIERYDRLAAETQQVIQKIHTEAAEFRTTLARFAMSENLRAKEHQQMKARQDELREDWKDSRAEQGINNEAIQKVALLVKELELVMSILRRIHIEEGR